jgi:hypothetical protein
MNSFALGIEAEINFDFRLSATETKRKNYCSVKPDPFRGTPKKFKKYDLLNITVKH